MPDWLVLSFFIGGYGLGCVLVGAITAKLWRGVWGDPPVKTITWMSAMAFLWLIGFPAVGFMRVLVACKAWNRTVTVWRNAEHKERYSYRTGPGRRLGTGERLNDARKLAEADDENGVPGQPVPVRVRKTRRKKSAPTAKPATGLTAQKPLRPAQAGPAPALPDFLRDGLPKRYQRQWAEVQTKPSTAPAAEHTHLTDQEQAAFSLLEQDLNS